jgi:hypothetical protein
MNHAADFEDDETEPRIRADGLFTSIVLMRAYPRDPRLDSIWLCRLMTGR